MCSSSTPPPPPTPPPPSPVPFVAAVSRRCGWGGNRDRPDPFPSGWVRRPRGPAGLRGGAAVPARARSGDGGRRRGGREEEEKERKEDVREWQLCVFRCLPRSTLRRLRCSPRRQGLPPSMGSVRPPDAQSGFYFIYFRARLFICSWYARLPLIAKRLLGMRRERGTLREFGRSRTTALGCDLLRVFWVISSLNPSVMLWRAVLYISLTIKNNNKNIP